MEFEFSFLDDCLVKANTWSEDNMPAESTKKYGGSVQNLSKSKSNGSRKLNRTRRQWQQSSIGVSIGK